MSNDFFSIVFLLFTTKLRNIVTEFDRFCAISHNQQFFISFYTVNLRNYCIFQLWMLSIGILSFMSDIKCEQTIYIHWYLLNLGSSPSTNRFDLLAYSLNHNDYNVTASRVISIGAMEDILPTCVAAVAVVQCMEDCELRIFAWGASRQAAIWRMSFLRRALFMKIAPTPQSKSETLCSAARRVRRALQCI